MDSSSGSPWDTGSSPGGSPALPTAEVVILGLSPPVSIVPLGTGGFGRELSSTSAVASEPELDICTITSRDLISLTLFIGAFDVVEYSGKFKVHNFLHSLYSSMSRFSFASFQRSCFSSSPACLVEPAVPTESRLPVLLRLRSHPQARHTWVQACSWTGQRFPFRVCTWDYCHLADFSFWFL